MKFGPITFQLTVVKSMQLFQIMRKGAVILVSILMAKSSLSQGAIGHFEMLLFIGYTFTFFWINSLLQALLPLFPELDTTEQKSFFFTIYTFVLGLSMGVFTLLQLGGDALTEWVVGEAQLPHLRVFSLYLLINIPTFVLEYFYLLQKRPVPIVSFGLFSFSLHVLVILLPLFLGFGLDISFLGLVVLAIIKHLWTLAFLFYNSRLDFRKDLLGRHWQLMLPLMLFTLLSGLTTIFDNWLVGWFYEDEALFAIFRFGAKELPLVMAMTGAFSAALIPEIATDLDAALQMIKQKSVKLFHFLFPISILLVLTSHTWFPLVFNEAFAPGAAIFNVYLLLLISRMLFTHTILIGLKKTNVVLIISVIEVTINILLSLWWIHIWGMVGIAMATVVAFTLEKILTMIYLRRWKNIRPQQYINWGWFAFYSLILVLGFLISLTI